MPTRTHEDLCHRRCIRFCRDQSPPCGLAGKEGGFDAVKFGPKSAFHPVRTDEQRHIGYVGDLMPGLDLYTRLARGCFEYCKQLGAVDKAKVVGWAVAGQIKYCDRSPDGIMQFDPTRRYGNFLESRPKPKRLDHPHRIG